MDISESGFQTPARRNRKASDSSSLPPLIAAGIGPKFSTQIQGHERTEAVPQEPQSF